MSTDYLKNLNQDQLQAVLHETGPAMVLAGAGSGKTRVLTTRVAHLIKKFSLKADQILLVTFTNKASSEMNNRVITLTGQKLPMSGTFHSLAAKILRKNAHYLKYSPHFSIYDPQDQLSVIKAVYRDLNLSPKELNPKSAKNRISGLKNEMIGPSQYKDMANTYLDEMTAKIYQAYNDKLMSNQALDFDDLLLKLVELFTTEPEVLKSLQHQFEHILVDEYQDTNKIQYAITKSLALPQENLFVVGDFSQSIYAWRGADFRNMLLLRDDFAHIKEYRLEQNYRSTQTILDAAHSVINKNLSHPILSLWTEETYQEGLELIEAFSGKNEAQEVINIIKKERLNTPLQEMVILYRTNAQSREFEEALLASGIPYKLVGGFKFYERKEIKDLLAMLSLTVNKEDQISLERAKKIGKKRFDQFWQLIDDNEKINELTQEPQKLLEQILEKSQYLEKFDNKDPDDLSKLDNIKELINLAGEFNDLTTFLENIALVQDNSYVDIDENGQQNAVTLMSFHSAKGLEFEIVFMVGMEDGLMPHSRSFFDKSQMEEERRLAYVGITRAKRKLYFSYAKKRWSMGNSSYSILSRFVRDIPENLFVRQDDLSDNKKLTSSNQERRLVLDEDNIEAFLKNEIDVDSLLQ